MRREVLHFYESEPFHPWSFHYHSAKLLDKRARAIAAAPDLELVAATDRPDSHFIGHDAGEVAKIGANGVIIGSEPETLFGLADVVIDFTSPSASLHHAKLAEAHETAMVIGTTGLSADDETELVATTKGNTVIYCANTSVGVTLLTQLVEEVAAKLTHEWDIEILETHHHHKVDAPSGTALALGKAAAKGRGALGAGEPRRHLASATARWPQTSKCVLGVQKSYFPLCVIN